VSVPPQPIEPIEPIEVVLTREPIDPSALARRVADGATGATAIFLGTVRDEHRGRPVLRLDYEAYAPMALREMRRIAAELRERFPVRRAAIVHRLGTLEIGEASICIALSLPHRADSFAALRFAIDTFKDQVPIWKREHFADGESLWVEGS
jgi:molybdopterin synthase catalytic subunit